MKTYTLLLAALAVIVGSTAQAAVSIPWNDVSKTGSSLAHLQTRNFTQLQNIDAGFTTFLDALTIDSNPVQATDYLMYRSAVGGLRRITISNLLAGASGDITEVQGSTNISVANGTGPIPVLTLSNPELIALATTGSAADRLPYYNGSEQASLAVFTSAGRDMVGAADVAAQLLLLGLDIIEAASVAYDNAVSGLTAITAQAAIDELKVAVDAISFPGLADDNEATDGEAMDSSDPRANVGGTSGTTYVFQATTDFTMLTGAGDLGKALIMCDPSGGDAAHIVTPPDPTAAGRTARVIVHDGASGTLTIDLDTDVVLDEEGESLVMLSNGTAWKTTPNLFFDEILEYAISDETTALTSGTAKISFRMPFAATLRSVRASLTTTSSSGVPTFDINEGGTTVISTKLTVDVGETTSTTAAAAAVISDADLADDALMTVDIDTAGTGATGAKIKLYVRRQ